MHFTISIKSIKNLISDFNLREERKLIQHDAAYASSHLQSSTFMAQV